MASEMEEETLVNDEVCQREIIDEAINAPFFAGMAEYMKEISSFYVEKNWNIEENLTIADGGFGQVFNKDDLADAIKNQVPYHFHGALFAYTDPLKLSLPHVPMMMKQISNLQAQKYDASEPTKIQTTIHLVLQSKRTPAKAITAGAFRLNGDEDIYAAFQGFGLAIKAGADHSVMLKWDRLMRSCAFEVEVITGYESRYMRVLQLKLDAGIRYAAVMLNSLQQVFEAPNLFTLTFVHAP